MFLEIKGLKKGFGSGDSRTEVLRGIDFSVPGGKTTGAHNGAGVSPPHSVIGRIPETPLRRFA